MQSLTWILIEKKNKEFSLRITKKNFKFWYFYFFTQKNANYVKKIIVNTSL